MVNASEPARRSADGRPGSRRIFPPQFKLQVLEAYRRDADCRGNQRATARKFGIHRRQIQKWLQAEPGLRASLLRRAPSAAPSPPPCSAREPEAARLAPSPQHVRLAPSPQHAPLSPHMTTAVESFGDPSEPMDLSLKRSPEIPAAWEPPAWSSPAREQAAAAPPAPPREPVKLFRPYLLPDKPTRPSAFSAWSCRSAEWGGLPRRLAPLR